MKEKMVYVLLIFILVGLTFITISAIEKRFVHIHKSYIAHNTDVINCINSVSNKKLGSVSSITTIAFESRNYFRLSAKDSDGKIVLIECDPSNNLIKTKDFSTITELF